MEQRWQLLDEYLQQYPCINRSQYARLAGRSYKQAVVDLNRFIEEVLMGSMGWGRVWCMPERGKIQDVYLHPNRNAKDISRELNMDKGLLFRILKKLEAKSFSTPQNLDQSTHALFYEKAGFRK